MKCFEYHKQNITNCENKNCRFWINKKDNTNCGLNAAKEKSMTLEELGEIFNVTRMRICQIEKRAIEKIKEKLFHLI